MNVWLEMRAGTSWRPWPRLAHLAETFEGASRLLLSLAEAENERWANNATGEFVSMFAGGHPEVSVSLAQRAMFLARARALAFA